MLARAQAPRADVLDVGEDGMVACKLKGEEAGELRANSGDVGAHRTARFEQVRLGW